MTLLKVHDFQQDLASTFLKLAKAELASKKANDEKKQNIYLHGQELGFCNDDIEVLLEDIQL